VRLIGESRKKDDRLDAPALVKNVVFERFMPQLRSEIETWH
jgi:hypothetical protein